MGGGRWAVDHLIVDQDAVPTLVEVKRGENPEIRRSIVGQILEYAAHAAMTWTTEELRRSFEETSRERDRDPEQSIADLLGPNEAASADRFWDEVARNLAANRLRLLFVADEIPEPLKRVAEFLHAQMPGDRGLRRRGEAVPGRRGADARSARLWEHGRHPVPPALARRD